MPKLAKSTKNLKINKLFNRPSFRRSGMFFHSPLQKPIQQQRRSTLGQVCKKKNKFNSFQVFSQMLLLNLLLDNNLLKYFHRNLYLKWRYLNIYLNLSFW